MDKQQETSNQPDERADETPLLECKKCGRELPASTRFCRECGAAQRRDAFPLLFVACLAIALAVFLAWQLSASYSLPVAIAGPMFTLVVLALIISFVLWR